MKHYLYRYIGDLPTVFITLRKGGVTWTPERGDTIDSDVPVHHPLLELVQGPDTDHRDDDSDVVNDVADDDAESPETAGPVVALMTA